MTRLTWVAVLSVVVLLGHLRPAWTADEPNPADGDGATQRAKEVAALLDSGDVAALKKYVEENFVGRIKTMPTERHVEFLLSMQDANRGLELQSVEKEGTTRANALLKGKLTGRPMTLRVAVEPKPPFRVIELGIRGPGPSDGEQPAVELTDDEIRQQMDALMKKLAEADVFSGAVLLARDGVPIFQGAYGTANKDFSVPNQIDTKFNLGSMNKMITAVAIAQLVERGKLSFDDPLSKFLPEFPDPESAKKIQIKHLLTHTSGLGSYFSKPWQESSRAMYRTVDDMLRRAAQDEKLMFLPGRRHRYSNTGMLVAGKVVEVASGQDYFEYVRENITSPSGMLNTDCYELDKVNPNLAVGYEKVYSEDGISFRNNLFEHVMRGGPMGGGYSTVKDLLRFDMALRSNKLVGAEYVKLLLSGKSELNSPDYGFGFVVNTEQKIAGHSGGFLGISSNLDMFLDTGWTAVVMSNYGRGSIVPEEKMRELVLSQIRASANAERADKSAM
jgi:CubicO group peptidase (beta-lactamase class C family)